MKLFLFSLLLLLIGPAAQSQQADSSALRLHINDQQLRKAKTQKTIGWIITGTGLPVLLFSAFSLLYFDKDALSDKGTVGAVLAVSSLYTFAGTRLIRAGRKNQQKAMSFAFNFIDVEAPCLTGGVQQLQPALTLKIPIY